MDEYGNFIKINYNLLHSQFKEARYKELFKNR